MRVKASLSIAALALALSVGTAADAAGTGYAPARARSSLSRLRVQKRAVLQRFNKPLSGKAAAPEGMHVSRAEGRRVFKVAVQENNRLLERTFAVRGQAKSARYADVELIGERVLTTRSRKSMAGDAREQRSLLETVWKKGSAPKRSVITLERNAKIMSDWVMGDHRDHVARVEQLGKRKERQLVKKIVLSRELDRGTDVHVHAVSAQGGSAVHRDFRLPGESRARIMGSLFPVAPNRATALQTGDMITLVDSALQNAR